MLDTLELIQFGVAVFAAMLGATYQLASRNMHSEVNSRFLLVVSFISAVFLTTLLEALLMFKGHINWLWVCVFGLLFSLGAEHLIRLAMNYQKGARSLWQYLMRMKKVNDLINSGKIDFNDDSTDEKPQTTERP